MQPVLWHVYHVRNCRHTRPNPKDKFVVIVHIDSNPRGFLINSQISNWLQNRPKLLVCQARIQAQDAPFLSHDSYVACHDLYEFFNDELTNSRGPIDLQTKNAILQAVKTCPTIEQKYKNIILTQTP